MITVLHNLTMPVILLDLAKLSFVLTPLSALATVIVGLGIWRYQLIAARRYNVVEQALTAANQAVSDLHYIRRARSDADAFAAMNPDSLRHTPWYESQTRIQGADENFRNLSQAAKAIELHFGQRKSESFDELTKIYNSLITAQGYIYFRWPAAEKVYTKAEKDQIRDYEKILSCQGDGDPITSKIDMIDKNLKRNFWKYIRPNILRLFLPY